MNGAGILNVTQTINVQFVANGKWFAIAEKQDFRELSSSFQKKLQNF